MFLLFLPSISGCLRDEEFMFHTHEDRILSPSISGCLQQELLKKGVNIESYRPLYRAVYSISAILEDIHISYRPLYRAVYRL